MTTSRRLSVVAGKPAMRPASGAPGKRPGGSGGADAARDTAAGSGVFCDRPFDLHRYRTVFPHLWMDFLHRHFHDHIHVAFVFSVNERTARGWWEGINAPRPEYALAAVKHVPGAAAMLLEAA